MGSSSTSGCLRSIAWVLFITVAILILITRDYGCTTESKDHSATLALIKKEPKVIDAFVNSADVLYVSVQDDGTKRDGFASYLCEVLNENLAGIYKVKVVRHNDRKMTVLGEANCR